jgi:agmatine deiminase
MGFPPTKTWWGEGIKIIREECVNVANTLSDYELVKMLVCPDDEAIARKLLGSGVEIEVLPIDDIWLRDTGPLTLIDGHGNRQAVGFRFDGWGGKCPHENDKTLKRRLTTGLGIECVDLAFVLEGGAICVDGEGTLITTEQCLLNKERNQQVKKAGIESLLEETLGIKKVIWLSNGLVPDEYTDGHVDGICSFVAPGTVVLHTTNDTSDDNFAICQDAKRRLEEEVDARGRRLEIIEIPLGETLSHINFYIANECVLVPTSGCSAEDDIPLGILQEVLAPRRVIGIKSLKLAEGGGGVHCITMQVPTA